MAGSLLKPQKRMSLWAKHASAKDPHLVLNLSSLPSGVTKLQRVSAVTLAVPHTCRNASSGVDQSGADDVRILPAKASKEPTPASPLSLASAITLA